MTVDRLARTMAAAAMAKAEKAGAELPKVTDADNGKILGVDSGIWKAVREKYQPNQSENWAMLISRNEASLWQELPFIIDLSNIYSSDRSSVLALDIGNALAAFLQTAAATPGAFVKTLYNIDYTTSADYFEALETAYYLPGLKAKMPINQYTTNYLSVQNLIEDNGDIVGFATHVAGFLDNYAISGDSVIGPTTIAIMGFAMPASSTYAPASANGVSF